MCVIYCWKCVTWGTLSAWSIRTAFAVFETTVRSTFGEIRWKNMPFMTLSTVTIDDMVTSFDGRRLTFSIRLIDCISLNTVTAVLVIIEAFSTVWNVTLFANLNSSKRFMINIPSVLTFKTCVFLHTCITVSYRTVCCLWSCCMNFLPNTTVLDGVSRNVCITVNSPISTPWILYNPISFCIPD